MDVNEKTYLKLFNQDSFAKLLGDLIDRGVEFKGRHNDLIMEVFSGLPIPTNKDMDSLYKTVYDLNK